ncbi:MAG: CapA family protein [Deltaproteobacteria bacterium]|jgi:poly-gamma-glutamate synthesis protein (capsule biosynthesis protein)|nr:CapA family protein [Deltaproteobacteria bacterium]
MSLAPTFFFRRPPSRRPPALRPLFLLALCLLAAAPARAQNPGRAGSAISAVFPFSFADIPASVSPEAAPFFPDAPDAPGAGVDGGVAAGARRLLDGTREDGEALRRLFSPAGPAPRGFPLDGGGTGGRGPSVVGETDDLGFLTAPRVSSGPAVYELPATVPGPLVGRDCLVRVVAVGDVLIHDSVRQAAETDGAYDFSPNFEHVRQILSRGDLVVANLENPLAGNDRRLAGYPVFNAPVELAVDLREAGFTMVTLANNHSMDRGASGLAHTIKTVDAAGLEYAGAYLDPDDKRRRLVGVFNGVKIAVLAYAYGLNGLAPPKPADKLLLGLIDLPSIFADMREARSQGADFVIVALHFGEEYQRTPDRRQLKLVEDIFRGLPEEGLAGPDLIFGHHPHVVQPFFFLKGPPGGPGQAVIYSLGNFMSGQPFPHTYTGLIMEVELRLLADGRRTAGPFRFTPTYCLTDVADGRRFYKVVPMGSAAQNPEAYGLSPARGEMMTRTRDEMEEHVMSLVEKARRDAEAEQQRAGAK